AILLHGGRLQSAVGGGIDQQLEGKWGPTPVSRQQGDDSGQIATSRVATDCNPHWITVELGCMLGDPLSRGVAIFGRSGELVLWGEAVVYRDHHAACAIGQAPAGGVVAIEVTNHPAAAVKVDQHWEWAVARGCVDANGNLPLRAGDRTVLDAGDWLCLREHR